MNKSLCLVWVNNQGHWIGGVRRVLYIGLGQVLSSLQDAEKA